MNVNEFIQTREEDWKQLEALILKHQGRRRLTAVEARQMGILYRAVVSDLAVARRDYGSQRVTVYLNQLLTRVHAYIYKEDLSNLKRLSHYFLYTIPQTFRDTAVFTLVSFLLFMIPAIIGYGLAYSNPDVATPLGLSSQREILANKSIWTEIPVEDRPYASSFIMTNNIRVAVLAFGGGMVFGVFALYLLAVNGLTIGATLGLAAHYGLGGALFEFIIGHGVIELSVIFISGGAGLQLAWAMLNPGFYTRRDAVALAARRAIPLIVVSILLLIVAGIIEGFISPSDMPFTFKALIGIGSGFAMYSYLGLVGHNLADKSDSPPIEFSQEV